MVSTVVMKTEMPVKLGSEQMRRPKAPVLSVGQYSVLRAQMAKLAELGFDSWWPSHIEMASPREILRGVDSENFLLVPPAGDFGKMMSAIQRPGQGRPGRSVIQDYRLIKDVEMKGSQVEGYIIKDVESRLSDLGRSEEDIRARLLVENRRFLTCWEGLIFSFIWPDMLQLANRLIFLGSQQGQHKTVGIVSSPAREPILKTMHISQKEFVAVPLTCSREIV